MYISSPTEKSGTFVVVRTIDRARDFRDKIENVTAVSVTPATPNQQISLLLTRDIDAVVGTMAPCHSSIG